MKFITEEYLRDLYKKEPFSTYELNQGDRLTPGAMEYLSDRGIKIVNEVSLYGKKSKSIPVENNNNKKRLCYKLRSIEAKFLLTSSEILEKDIILSKDIISLSKNIKGIKNFIEGKGQLDNLICKECTGIKLNNFYNDIDDCFDIEEFYINLEKNNEIFKLHMLRCEIHELKPYIFEVYENEENNLENIMKSINSIINSLSQMICLSTGGKRCQREK